MSEMYEEIVVGETLRRTPGPRHEQICLRLHERLASHISPACPMELLPVRSLLQVGAGTLLRPDLTVVLAGTKEVYLVAEIVDPSDHRTDTVVKKEIYESTPLSRLWMIDPRYDNVEVYHRTPYGLALKGILAHREVLEDSQFPSLRLAIQDLFEAG